MIKIICFNKLDENFKIVHNFYLERLSKFIKIEIVIINEFSCDDLNKNKEKNSFLIEDKIKGINKNNVYLLDINSKMVDSMDISKIIDKKCIQETSDLFFIIGPSDGFTSNFISMFTNRISFGKITLPHLLCRVVLLEQLYRAFKIINNQKYHK